MSQCCWTEFEPGTPPWEAGVGRVTVREFESLYNHYFPRYCTKKVQSHIQWSAAVYSSGINRADCEIIRSLELRGNSSCRLHFLEGLLIGEQWWMRFNLCRKTKISCQTFVVLCSQLINHFQTYQSTSTHTHTHHLTYDPSVHCSADTVRTVVGGFLNLSFENCSINVGMVWA